MFVHNGAVAGSYTGVGGGGKFLGLEGWHCSDGLLILSVDGRDLGGFS